MLLHCTLVRSPGAALQESPAELTIEGPSGRSGMELQEQLAARFGTGKVTVDGQSISSLTLGQPPLVNGAVLVDRGMADGGFTSRQRSSEPPASLALAVNSGAGAGIVVPLRRGTYTIGRSDGEILIPDADLSRSHARLVVTETAISLEDLDSANGIEVDGERVRHAIVSTGSTIRCGNSTMSLVFLEQPNSRLHAAGLAVDEPLVVSRRDGPANRAALWLAAVLPLVIGVGLAVVTGMWMFLAFTAVSVISVLVPLVSGRRQRRELAAAVRAAVAHDQERRRRAAPSLSDLTVGVLHGSVGVGGGAAAPGPVESQSAPPPADGVWLRLGQAEQPANLRFDPPDPGQPIPSAGVLPLTLNPGRPLTTIRGPQASADGMVRSLVMQLAGYPSGRGTRVLIHGNVDRLPLAARYLDGFTLSSTAATSGTVLERGVRSGHGVLILLDTAVSADGIIQKAHAEAWQVFRFASGTAAASPADVELREGSSLFRAGDQAVRFAPDLVPQGVFNTFCRRLAQDAHGTGNSNRAMPVSCRLEDLLPHSAAETATRWSTNRNRPGLSVPVGVSLDRVRLLDLQSDGPHLLVAGTTGSGKSELLRTLTVALALSYPPDRINFLFVDFKGGSGLGPLAGLPHCVGILTDLTSHELERALQSLRAEIRFREKALAEVQAPDLATYRDSAVNAPPLSHLVIVIDEFRMLVEEAPEALSELMRIASIGRSLGIHLIMATQRPQGALTADIRANVTTSIALRVQSEMESTDIINSHVAAGISVDTPGRAFLGRATEAPLEFQAASLTAGAGASTSGPSGVSVMLASEFIEAAPVSGESQAGSFSGAISTEPTPAKAIAPLLASMSALWTSMNGAAVRKPVAPSLPLVLPEPERDADACNSQTWSVRLGLMDVPSEQKTAPLVWEPARHGHLGLVGAPESGMQEAVKLAVLSVALHPREYHLYLLDPDGSFEDLASHGRVGARAGLHEIRRAVRVLERLAREQSLRLGRKAAQDTPIVLAIAGWGSWVSAFRAGPWGWAEELVSDLVRDGGRAGITVLISGQRELVTSRFFAALPSRVYFPTGSSEDSRIAWPKLPPMPPISGRAVAVGALASGKNAVCQFYAPSSTEAQIRLSRQPGEPPLLTVPFRIEPLPERIPAAEIPEMLSNPGSAQSHRLLRIGVGGDELDPVSLRVQSGGVLAVLGGPQSGKSSFMRLLPKLNQDSGPWLRPDAEPAVYWPKVLRQAVAGEIDRRSVALVDDADLLPQEVNRSLAELPALGITVVFTAGFSPVLPQRVLLAIPARNSGLGVLVAPRTLLDGDLFGVRFEAEPNPPPGRSIVIQNGRATAVQLGWQPPDEHPGEPPAERAA
ncbi:FtsK/SpoIIIE domain-containing protein [Pseudarthrobacter sp. DSP2-3-2b1]|uniref:FtsK/SpoIIIE domain-containing protein n=1 Tax=Pseudarthrobacter sp. DSP2-3-2b1 TaxID=2804661 RepID=UPI003CF20325